MVFMKPVIIYEQGNTKVYINQCHAVGRKTKVFAVRKDDRTGLAEYLGSIVFNPRWRQYVFVPEKETIWSKSCLYNITSFLVTETRKWRDKLKQKG